MMDVAAPRYTGALTLLGCYAHHLLLVLSATFARLSPFSVGYEVENGDVVYRKQLGVPPCPPMSRAGHGWKE